MQIQVTDMIDPTARQCLADGLRGFNESVIGPAESAPLAVLVRGSGDESAVGGLVGRTSAGVLFIELFFLPKSLRRQGLGRQIIAAAEAEAKRRGCIAAVLHTRSFQAPGFYARQGYREAARIPSQPPGTYRAFTTKDLV